MSGTIQEGGRKGGPRKGRGNNKEVGFTWDIERGEWIKHKVAWEKQMQVGVGTYDTKRGR